MGAKLDGKALARRIEAGLQGRVRELSASGVTPKLVVVLVGDDPASQVYVRHKERACERVGIASEIARMPTETSEDDLLGVVERLNADDEVHGILVQLPLPRHVNAHTVLNRIDPDKDVDGFHFVNAGHLATDRAGFMACTPKGVMRMLREYEVPLRGAHAVVVGRSRVVGRPMAAMLLAADCTVTTCHRHTVDTARFTRQGDIVVVAVGKPGLVRRHWIKPGAVVIDVGTSRTAEGRIAGDVAFDEVQPVAGLISPVPGGVGPMTIAMLLENTVEAAERIAAGRTVRATAAC